MQNQAQLQYDIVPLKPYLLSHSTYAHRMNKTGITLLGRALCLHTARSMQTMSGERAD